MPVLDERARVEQQVEPLAHRQLAERALALDRARARPCASGVARGALEVVDERPPVVQVRLVGHAPASITETHTGRRGGAH